MPVVSLSSTTTTIHVTPHPSQLPLTTSNTSDPHVAASLPISAASFSLLNCRLLTHAVSLQCAQDSKPYIVSAKANAVIPDPAGRNQGFTIAANTIFASLDDMKYYDEDCEAHKAIKAFLKPKIQGAMTVYHEAD